jgi:hypothetical protein
MFNHHVAMEQLFKLGHNMKFWVLNSDCTKWSKESVNIINREQRMSLLN